MVASECSCSSQEAQDSKYLHCRYNVPSSPRDIPVIAVRCNQYEEFTLRQVELIIKTYACWHNPDLYMCFGIE